jgi:hypothetical protein
MVRACLVFLTTATSPGKYDLLQAFLSSQRCWYMHAKGTKYDINQVE